MLYANYILIRQEEKLYSKVSKCCWKMVLIVNTGCFNLYLKMQYLEEEQKSKKNVEADSAFLKAYSKCDLGTESPSLRLGHKTTLAQRQRPDHVDAHGP